MGSAALRRSCARARGGILAVLAALCFAPLASAQTGDIVLKAGESRNDSATSTPHRYRVEIPVGQSAELSLRQLGDARIDLAWRSASAADHAPRTSLAGRQSSVRVLLVADRDSSWSIDVSTAKAGDAAYSIALGAPHATSANDRHRAAAEDAMARADALMRSGEKDASARAQPLYAESIRDWQQSGDRCGLRQAYVAVAELHHGAGNASGQRSAAESALQQTCEGDIAEEALAGRLLGSALINQGDFAAGTKATERAVTLFEQTGDAHNEGVALRNLGLAYAEMGEIEKARTRTQAALKIATETGDAKLRIFARNDLAFLHSVRGEFAAAIEAYRQSLDDLRATPDPVPEAVAWINLGLAYSQLGDSDEALRAYAKGETVSSANGCWPCLAEIAANRGDDLLDSGRIEEAEAAYRRALAIAETHQLARQHAEALRGLGRCAMAERNWMQARSLLESARAELHRTQGRLNESVVYAMLGDLEGRQNRLDAARKNYTLALSLARQAANQTWQTVALASLARVAQQSGDLEGAKRNVEEAIALIESERARINAPDLRTSYFSTMRSYYELYIDILMQRHARRPDLDDGALALSIAERARARFLQDQLAERAIAIDKSVDPALIADEHSAEDRLHALAYRVTQIANGEPAAHAAAQSEIDEASHRLDEIRGRLRAANPHYAELTHPAPLTLDEIQKRWLDDDVGVLEYWLGEQRSYLWLITREGLRSFALPPRADIERAADALRDALVARPDVSATSMEDMAAHDDAEAARVRGLAAALALQILPPEAMVSLHREVAVVADGSLQLLPFNLFGAGADSRVFVYLPSIGTLRGLRGLPQSSASAGSLAILADPVFRADDIRLAGRSADATPTDDALLLRAANEAGIAHLPRLPNTRTEAEAIGALGAKDASWIALDFAANRDAALAARWSDYRIVHFATHALVNSSHPELSGIVLSLYDANGRAQDGFLRMNDIYNLRMPADLVVLSVCDSALGKSVGTEGVFSLSRAFFYAGTRHVVASLWPVDDRASAAFMKAFYRALLESGDAPQVALARAQDELRANARWRLPFYWAGFVVQGDWQ